MAIVITGNNTPTAGGVTYGDGTTYANTAAGTSGQVLQSNGASAPSWITPSAGSFTLISTATASNSATLTFTGISSTYDLYFIELVEIVGASASSLRMRTSFDGGANYDTSGYMYQSFGYTSAVTAWTTDFDGSSTFLPVWNNNCGAISTTASYSGLSANVYLMSPASSAYTKYFATAVWFTGAAANSYAQITGAQMSTSPVNAIQFLMASGNIASGKIRLYGIANS